MYINKLYLQNGSLGIDVASTAALGGAQKVVMGSKTFLNTRFAKNLSEGLHAAKGTITSACERALKSNDDFLRLGKPVTAETRAAASGTSVTTAEKEVVLAQLPAPKIQQHHIFPQQFKDYFSQRGIHIDDYCVDLGSFSHLSGVHGTGNLGQMPGHRNNRWKVFIDRNPDASTREVYQFAGQLMDEFNLRGLEFKKYK